MHAIISRLTCTGISSIRPISCVSWIVFFPSFLSCDHLHITMPLCVRIRLRPSHILRFLVYVFLFVTTHHKVSLGLNTALTFTHSSLFGMLFWFAITHHKASGSRPDFHTFFSCLFLCDHHAMGLLGSSCKDPTTFTHSSLCSARLGGYYCLIRGFIVLG